MSRKFSGGAEENHENPPLAELCPSRNANQAHPEYKHTVLPLRYCARCFTQTALSNLTGCDRGTRRKAVMGWNVASVFV